MATAKFEVIAAAGSDPAQLLIRADNSGSLAAMVATSIRLSNVVGGTIVEALRIENGKSKFFGDVEVMAGLLSDLGTEVEGIGTTTLRIRAANVRTHEPDRALVGRLRGSVLLLGPLLARTGRVHIPAPGGDFPARRTIATHLDALQAMGARVSSGPDHFLEAPDGAWVPLAKPVDGAPAGLRRISGCWLVATGGSAFVSN